MSQWDRDAYNMTTRSLYLSFKEFVAMHYALSKREDTQYWKDISKKEFQPMVANCEPHQYSGFADLAERKINTNRYETTA